MAALARASPSGVGLVLGLDWELVLVLDREPAPRRESRSCSALMRHKLEAGVGLSSFFPPEEVSFVQIACPCQPCKGNLEPSLLFM